jgi:hypothetical protein
MFNHRELNLLILQGIITLSAFKTKTPSIELQANLPRTTLVTTTPISASANSVNVADIYASFMWLNPISRRLQSIKGAFIIRNLFQISSLTLTNMISYRGLTSIWILHTWKVLLVVTVIKFNDLVLKICWTVTAPHPISPHTLLNFQDTREIINTLNPLTNTLGDTSL